jgi:hypothetical protein
MSQLTLQQGRQLIQLIEDKNQLLFAAYPNVSANTEEIVITILELQSIKYLVERLVDLTIIGFSVRNDRAYLQFGSYLKLLEFQQKSYFSTWLQKELRQKLIRQYYADRNAAGLSQLKDRIFKVNWVQEGNYLLRTDLIDAPSFIFKDILITLFGGDIEKLREPMLKANTNNPESTFITQALIDTVSISLVDLTNNYLNSSTAPLSLILNHVK